MRKILVALIIILSLSSTSLAASEDIYVRQDVFDAKMEVLFTRLDAKIDAWGAETDKKIARLDAKIDSLGADMDKKIARLDAKIDAWGAETDKKIARLDAKIDSLGADMDKKIERLDVKIDSAIGELRNEMKNEIGELKVSNGEIRGDIKALDARVSNIENNVSWWIGGLTLFLTGLALVPLVWTIVEKLRKPLFSLEDVRRLIEENNAKLTTMFAPRAA
ncbi:MAG: hypothetical protein IJ859_03770 [Synergistaceae bacterium]|nr:hypothetical protein [Synergistaceae bacterium]